STCLHRAPHQALGAVPQSAPSGCSPRPSSRTTPRRSVYPWRLARPPDQLGRAAPPPPACLPAAVQNRGTRFRRPRPDGTAQKHASSPLLHLTLNREDFRTFSELLCDFWLVEPQGGGVAAKLRRPDNRRTQPCKRSAPRGPAPCAPIPLSSGWAAAALRGDPRSAPRGRIL